MKPLKLSLIVALLATLTLPTFGDTLTWVGPTTGGTWQTAANWENTAFENVIPTFDDIIIINSTLTNTVEVNSPDAILLRFGAGGTVNINNGGVLTGDNAYTLRYITKINLYSGGSLHSRTATSIYTWDLRTSLDINTGATFTGTDSIFDGKTLNIMGTWNPLGDSASALSFRLGSATTNATVNLDSGKIVLDVFGDGVNEYFDLTSPDRNSTLNLDGDEGGTIELNPVGYTPQIGDSFDLWEYGGTNILSAGDGSNISLPGYTLDLSQWATDGIVTIIPEPATLGLLAIGGIALLKPRRRK